MILATAVATLAIAGGDPPDPPCPQGVPVGAATIAAEDLEDRGGSLTATHRIALELQVAGEPDPVNEFEVAVPPGVRVGWAGTPTIRADAPGPVPVVAGWSEFVPSLGSSCSRSASTTLTIEPARAPRYIPPKRKSALMSQLEWFLRLGKDADLRPVEVRIRGLKRARVPGASVPARKLVFAFREGDKGVSYANGRSRTVRAAGWRFSAGFIRDRPRVLMHGIPGRSPFGVELDWVQGARRIGRTRLVGRCHGFVCDYRTARSP
jgi:hypothetical protein